MDCLISNSEVFCLKLFPVGISFIVKAVVSYGFIIPGNHGVVCASKLHEYILHTLESSFLMSPHFAHLMNILVASHH